MKHFSALSPIGGATVERETEEQIELSTSMRVMCTAWPRCRRRFRNRVRSRIVDQ